MQEATDVAAAVPDSPSSAPPESSQPAPPRIRRSWWWYFKWSVRAGVLAFIVGYLVFVKFDSFFYFPSRDVEYQPEAFRLKYEAVRIPTSDGLTLAGWFLPAEGDCRGTVVHFHGNAANITNHLTVVEWVPRAGFNLLMFDYRGYGESEGKVTRAGTIIDGNAALDFALRRPEVQGRPLFVYGQSLGAAVAVVVAADRPEVTAVVAESPFSGYRRIAAAHLQRQVYFGWLARGIAAAGVSSGCDPIDVVGRISPRPLLVIAAGRDDICYPELAQELFDAAGEPKEFWLAPEAKHLGILEGYEEELIAQITGFFNRAAAR